MPTRLYLLRHGEVAAEWRDRIYGCKDVPLSERGMEEARRAAERIPAHGPHRPRVVVSSGLARTAYGAQHIARTHGLPYVTRDDLREIERGEWVGRRPAEMNTAERERLRAWFRAPANTRAPGGESLADLDARVAPTLDALAREHVGAAVCVVAHLWVLRTAVCRALSLGLDRATRLDLRTGGLVVIDWPAGGREGEHLRPTLAGFGTDDPPSGSAWFRGPQRG